MHGSSNGITLFDLLLHLPYNVKSNLNILDLRGLETEKIPYDRQVPSMKSFKNLVDLRLEHVKVCHASSILESVGPQLTTLEIISFDPELAQMPRLVSSLQACHNLKRIYLPAHPQVWRAICQLKGLEHLGLNMSAIYRRSFWTEYILQSKGIKTLVLDDLELRDVLTRSDFWTLNSWNSVSRLAPV